MALRDSGRAKLALPGSCKGIEEHGADGYSYSDTNKCSSTKADLATIGPEATMKARRHVGPKCVNITRRHHPRRSAGVMVLNAALAGSNGGPERLLPRGLDRSRCPASPGGS